MTIYQWFESGEALRGFLVGAVPATLMARYNIYKTYVKFLDEGKSQEEARKMTMTACKIKDYSRMARAIYCFERVQMDANNDG